MIKTALKHWMLLVAAATLLFTGAGPIHGQELDVPYVSTPHEVVEAMLEVANVGPGDYVIDLGSGDGRIVIAAAALGAFGHGVDIDPVRVREAEENARASGVADRAVFLEENLFNTDLRRATVLTMYLLGTVNMQLRPVLFEQLRPGTRVVSHAFNMFDWEADAFREVNNRRVYFWIMPADLKGNWHWTADGVAYTMSVQQEFQKISVDLYAGKRLLQVRDPVLTGERVSFTAEDPEEGRRYGFSGHVGEGTINGTILTRSTRNRTVADWNAKREKP